MTTISLPNSQQLAPAIDMGRIMLVQYDINQEDTYLPPIRELISKDLSEPYSIYVYRYFLNNWSNFCWMVRMEKPSKYMTLLSNAMIVDGFTTRESNRYHNL
jgi:hypothetical protein